MKAVERSEEALSTIRPSFQGVESLGRELGLLCALPSIPANRYRPTEYIPAMIFPQVDIYVDFHYIATFLEAAKPVWDAVTNEPRCLSFEMFQAADPSDANVTIFRLFEVWDADEEWFVTVQAQKDYYKPYFEALKKLSAKPMVFGLWRRLGGWYPAKKDWTDELPGKTEADGKTVEAAKAV